MINAFNVTNP
jgi:hypothetical protein